MAGSYGRSMFRFLRSLQIFFHSGCSRVYCSTLHNNKDAPLLTNGSRKCGIYTQWRMTSYHLQVNGWKWRTSFWARLARLRKPKIVCSPSYADFRSRANTAMLLDLGHMTRWEHIWEVWGQEVNAKHESIWCPHSKGTLKWQRSTEEGDQEPV
jgi:hypothetical protein